MADFSPLFTWRSAVCDSDLSATDRHVALVLSLHMSERGDSCFPGQETLARETGRSRRTIIRSIQVLKEQGWLKVQHGKGRNHTNRYVATTPTKGDTVSPITDEEKVTSTTENVTPATGKGDKATHKDVKRTPERTPPGEEAEQPSSKRDLLWEAMVAVMGGPPETKSERGRWNKAVKELKDAGATPNDLMMRSTVYRQRYKTADLTPTALAANWSRLAPSSNGSGPGSSRYPDIPEARPGTAPGPWSQEEDPPKSAGGLF